MRQKIRKGMILCTFFLFPAVFYYLSPYLIVEATSKGIISGSFIIFTLFFISSFILGRAYCGWICPAAGCQEAIAQVRTKKVTKGNFIKWLIWIPWMTLIAFVAIKNHAYQKVDFFYQTTNGFSVGDFASFITYLFVLLLIVLPAFIVGRRSFCHHICWMAPFLIIGRKIRNIFGWASLHLKAKPDLCIHCHTCSENCPMSLPVEQMVKSNKMENTECILCATCVDGCESKAIGLGIVK